MGRGMGGEVVYTPGRRDLVNGYSALYYLYIRPFFSRSLVLIRVIVLCMGAQDVTLVLGLNSEMYGLRKE